MKEKWMNPQSLCQNFFFNSLQFIHTEHVEKLDKTSITNIHTISLKTQETVNQHSGVLDELR